jgi:hypothetical protein
VPSAWFPQRDARTGSRCYLICDDVIALHAKNVVIGKRRDCHAGLSLIPSRLDSLPDERLKRRFKFQLALDKAVFAMLV